MGRCLAEYFVFGLDGLMTLRWMENGCMRNAMRSWSPSFLLMGQGKVLEGFKHVLEGESSIGCCRHCGQA